MRSACELCWTQTMPATINLSTWTMWMNRHNHRQTHINTLKLPKQSRDLFCDHLPRTGTYIYNKGASARSFQLNNYTQSTHLHTPLLTSTKTTQCVCVCVCLHGTSTCTSTKKHLMAVLLFNKLGGDDGYSKMTTMMMMMVHMCAERVSSARLCDTASTASKLKQHFQNQNCITHKNHITLSSTTLNTQLGSQCNRVDDIWEENCVYIRWRNGHMCCVCGFDRKVSGGLVRHLLGVRTQRPQSTIIWKGQGKKHFPTQHNQEL